MHDIDPTELAAGGFGTQLGEFGESEQGVPDVPLHEAQELEFASRLLEVSNDQELEQFLGDVFRAVGSAVGQFARSGTGKALGAILKDTLSKALPIAAGVGASGTGQAADGELTGDLAQQAGSLLGLELEGLSPPDQEFETARQLVRFAGNAYRRAAWAPRNMSPRVAAGSAAAHAARRYAPGLWPRTGGVERRHDWRGWQSGRYGYPSRYRSTRGTYTQATPDYLRRQRPWRSQQAYGWPAYAWSYGTPSDAGAADEPGGYGPNGSGMPMPVIEPPVAAGPPVVAAPPFVVASPVVAGPPVVADPSVVAGPAAAPEPPAAASPGAAGEPPAATVPVTPPAEPVSAGELGEGFAGSGRWPPSGGAGHAGARSGRWERHGQVLIVYGI
jgi:hypothetical protein